MDEQSRIRFNPTTREIEVAGSEEFVKEYFEKLQSLLSSVPAREPSEKKARSTRKAEKTTAKEPGEKRVTNIDKVLQVIKDSPSGVSTDEIKEKTGLVERQIWSIVDRAAREGKIKKEKRGLYVAITA